MFARGCWASPPAWRRGAGSGAGWRAPRTEAGRHVIERGILGAVAVCIAATAGLWLLAMPDEPVRALQDGLGAAALATIIAGAAVRRSSE